MTNMLRNKSRYNTAQWQGSSTIRIASSQFTVLQATYISKAAQSKSNPKWNKI